MILENIENANGTDLQWSAYCKQFEIDWLASNFNQETDLSINKETTEKPYTIFKWLQEYDQKREALFESRRCSKIRTVKVPRKGRTKSEASS